MSERKDDKIRQLNFSDDFMLSSAEKRFRDGDYLGALTILNKRSGFHSPTADAAALAADVYESMELWNLAANCWFTFLDTCNEADFSEGYEGLAVCFMNMGEDAQAAYYFHEVYGDDEFDRALEEQKKPALRLVHSDDAKSNDSACLEQGIASLQVGDLEKAKASFAEVSSACADYPTAVGLYAMCTLMLGDEESAEQTCKELLEQHPDNIMLLSTYCAVLQARGNKDGAKEVALRLGENDSDKTEDIFRIATAMCETGLDREANQKLARFLERVPYDETGLYFYAVSAYRIGNTEEAVRTLEKLTTIYPKKAVAKYYLERMREVLGGEKRFRMNYFYRLPKEKYHEIADFFLMAENCDDTVLPYVQRMPALIENLYLASDEAEGRDEKLQLLAAKVAVKTRCDDYLREVLLDNNGDHFVKLEIMHALVMRNEDDSFGTVFLSVYREFYLHEIDVYGRYAKEFLTAFADVYSKFSFMNEDNERRIVLAAEDIFETLTPKITSLR